MELAYRDRSDRVEHPAPDPVAGSVQEFLESTQVPVAEQGLSQPRQQQHLEIDDVVDLARHLPEQLAGNHIRGRSRVAYGDRHIARGFSVTDDEHMLAAHLVGRVQFGCRKQLPAGGDKLFLSREGRPIRFAEDAVGDDDSVEGRGCAFGLVDAAHANAPASVGLLADVFHFGTQPDVGRESVVVRIRLEVLLYLLAARPFGERLRHPEVGKLVLGLGALGRDSGVATGCAPDAAHVIDTVEYGHVVTRLLQYFGGGEPGDAGSNDGDVHESSKCATAVWRCCNLRRALSSVHLAVPLSGTLFWESGSLRIGA